MVERVILPVLLSMLAGYVDALGFLQLGGLFISFMSGNSTQLSVGLVSPKSADAGVAAAIIAAFVVGVVLGALPGPKTGRWHQTIVLVLETLLLWLAALAQAVSVPVLAVGAMTIAMGVENNVFQRNGQVSIGLTYMTGTLVRIGQSIAAAIHGGERWGWVADFCLWVGLVLGAMAGAEAYHRFGLGALWPAAGYGAAITLWVALRQSRV